MSERNLMPEERRKHDELSRTCFDAGRWSLRLAESVAGPKEGAGCEESWIALGDYARGVWLCLAGTHCAPADALVREAEWVAGSDVGAELSDTRRWVLDLISLAQTVGVRAAKPAGLPPKAIVVSGGAAALDETLLPDVRLLLEQVLAGFDGEVISGGTTAGVPGCVGEVAAGLSGRQAKKFELIGYLPAELPHDADRDERYDELIAHGRSGFSPDQILQAWRNLAAKGVVASEVLCLGFGGGPLSGAEYRIALALGATVVTALGSGGAADALVEDPVWRDADNLMPLAMDTPRLNPGPDHARRCDGRTVDGFPELLDKVGVNDSRA